MQFGGDEHADGHAGHKDECACTAAGGNHQARARADAGEAPADAENSAAGEQGFIKRFAVGECCGGAKQGELAPAYQPERWRGNGDGGGHDDGECGVPVPGNVEKGEHIGGCGHAGEDQTATKEQAGYQRDER